VKSPLDQALQLGGHVRVEWFENLVFLSRAFLVINRNVSEA
jgi:hypothetical protein